MKLQEINIHFREIVFSCFEGKWQLNYSSGKGKFPFSNLMHSDALGDIIQTPGSLAVLLQIPRLSTAQQGWVSSPTVRRVLCEDSASECGAILGSHAWGSHKCFWLYILWLLPPSPALHLLRAK